MDAMNFNFGIAVKAFQTLDNLSSELKKEAERKDGQPSLRFPGDGEALLYKASAKQIGLLAAQLAVFTSEKESVQRYGQNILGPWKFYRCELCSLAVSDFHDFIVLELNGSQYIMEDGIAAVALFSMFDLAVLDLFQFSPLENRPLYVEHRIAKFWKVFWRGFMDTLLSPEKQAEQDAMFAGIIAAANEPMGDDPLRMLADDKIAYNQFRDECRDEREEPEPSGWARHADESE